jgi:trehalose 6-phosphate synthase
MGLAAHDRAYDAGYARANARFADTLHPLIEPDDLIWVQDYHLIPLARELRRRQVDNAIGFFLHIPWPARELVATLPNHRDLVESLFDYDLVGFQTEEWRNAFKSYVLYEANGSVSAEGSLHAFGRTLRAETFPVGIDAENFKALCGAEEAQESYARIQDSKGDRKMLLGVDRLDYSKGLEERLLAYERLLDDNPEFRRQVFLLQISTQTRVDVPEYQEIAARLDSLCGRINGAHAEMDWIPIRNIHRLHTSAELAGLYRAADAALATPLRDGMNLVAKEFVAAQDEADPGVLILSRFAGAAAQMPEALIVNPFSGEDVADAIKRALCMSPEERRMRWRGLMRNVECADVIAWRDAFVASLKMAQCPRGSVAALQRRAPAAPRLASLKGERQ